MKLLFDLGNSRLKWARLEPGGMQVQHPLDLDQGDWTVRLADALDTLPERPTQACICSVTQAARLQALAHVLTDRSITLHRLGPAHSDARLQLAYRDPAQFGVDRWLALRALRRRHPQAFLLACAGSALTIDVVDAEGRHLGGVIAPSAPRALEALHARASHLQTAGERITAFADNTADATWSGAWLAAAALIERVQAEAAHRLGDAVAIWLSGGDAGTLAGLLRGPVRQAPDLVLQGLADEATA
jgi:type III pantothenate kinase